jgi:hypothetical protein
MRDASVGARVVDESFSETFECLPSASSHESRSAFEEVEMKLRTGPGALLGLAALLAFCSVSCGNRTITPNEYSESVGRAVMKADEDACFKEGSAKRRELLEELMAGDPAIVGNENREAAGRSVGRTMGKMEGGSTAAGDLGAAIGEAMFSSRDPEMEDERRLAKYLGIEGGLGDGFSATLRLQNICLRAKGYRVERDEEDGSGTATLAWDPARVMLYEEDGSERIFYQYPMPEQ